MPTCLIAAVQTKLGGPLWHAGLPLALPLILGLGLTATFRLGQTGISFTFSPFYKRFYNWQDVDSAEVVHYSPLSDFGGWGWRYSSTLKASAYTIWGDAAVRVALKSGKCVYLGIPENAAKAIDARLKVYFPRT